MKNLFQIERGHALVEMALAFPLLVLIFLMSFDLVSLLWQKWTLESTTRSLGHLLMTTSSEGTPEERAQLWLRGRGHEDIEVSILSRVIPRVKRTTRFVDTRVLEMIEIKTTRLISSRLLPVMNLRSHVWVTREI